MNRQLENGESLKITECSQCGMLVQNEFAFPGKVIDGKTVCLKCYPLAVDIFLADQRLKKFEKRGKRK